MKKIVIFSLTLCLIGVYAWAQKGLSDHGWEPTGEQIIPCVDSQDPKCGDIEMNAVIMENSFSMGIKSYLPVKAFWVGKQVKNLFFQFPPIKEYDFVLVVTDLVTNKQIALRAEKFTSEIESDSGEKESETIGVIRAQSLISSKVSTFSVTDEGVYVDGEKIEALVFLKRTAPLHPRIALNDLINYVEEELEQTEHESDALEDSLFNLITENFILEMKIMAYEDSSLLQLEKSALEKKLLSVLKSRKPGLAEEVLFKDFKRSRIQIAELKIQQANLYIKEIHMNTENDPDRFDNVAIFELKGSMQELEDYKKDIESLSFQDFYFRAFSSE